MPRPSGPSYCISCADVVRATIARAVLNEPNEDDRSLGDVTLQLHQCEGAARLRAIIARSGGALLADDVGLGKTYTALAVARGYKSVAIVAPAALRAMWDEACVRCGVAAVFLSTESLSRQAPARGAADIVVVDEAHWFRNCKTKRYRSLAQLCRGSTVLLLSATPLHNRAQDLLSLLSLFLGPRARQSSPNELTALIVRRGRNATAHNDIARLPRVMPTIWYRVSADSAVVAALKAIEAPVPPRDGGLALALLRLTLLRRYASSDAALRATLQRMLARALSMADALRGGSYPTARELNAWLLSDEDIQLALPGMLTMNAVPNELLTLEALERHTASIRAALGKLRASKSGDRRRATILAQIVRRAGATPVVAFSQFAATVQMLRKLLPIAGVAVVTGKGVTVATGKASRGDVLKQLDASSCAPAPEAMRVRLLLASDLLSEGVNLHNAKTVIHLDLPWTVARLEQRVGRLSRIGSPHSEIHVVGFAPPNAVEVQHRVVARLRAKWNAATQHFGSGELLAHDVLVRQREAAPRSGYSGDAESLGEVLKTWLGSVPVHRRDPLVALVSAPEGTARLGLALLHTSKPTLVAIGEKFISASTTRVLSAAQRLSSAHDAEHADPHAIAEVVHRLHRFLAGERGRAALSDNAGRHIQTLMRLIAQATKTLPRAARPMGLSLAGEARAAIAKVRSAGDHAALSEVAERARGDTARRDPLQRLALLRDEICAITRRAPAQSTHDAMGSRIRAILISA